MNVPFIVLDTNICLDLFVFDDIHTRYLKKQLENKTLKAITRTDCYEEWKRVLDYPNLSLNEENKTKCLNDFDHFIQLVEIEPKDYFLLPQCKDKDDQKFLELAYDANALLLLTKDKALLKLASKTKRLNLFHITKPNESFISSYL